MSHYARINILSRKVDKVLSIREDVVKNFPDYDLWIQTSYNTRGGIHYGQDGQPDGGEALRKNYAGIGYSYDQQIDAFIPPKPFSSWILNEETCLWNAPIPYPTDDKVYRWNEDILSWVEIGGL